MTYNYQFQSVTLYISGTVDHIIKRFGTEVLAAPPLILAGDLKISDQNNWGEVGQGPEPKIKFKGGPKILGGPMNPNYAMVVVLKNILLFG